MQKYKCHKVVTAAKITGIGSIHLNEFSRTRNAHIDLEGTPYVTVLESWLEKHKPEVGGYFVIYEDGYQSYSPAKAFEGGYSITKPNGALSFGDALDALKAGKRVARVGWNGKGMWLSLSCNGSREVSAANFWSPHNAAHAHANGGTATVLPSITMKTATGEILMGWLASQTDMLAEDWTIID
jgi:hypothetical protein